MFDPYIIMHCLLKRFQCTFWLKKQQHLIWNYVKISCRLAIEKFSCFTESLNEGRPLLYACKGTDIRDMIISQFGGDAGTIDTSFDLMTCSGEKKFITC